MSEINEEGTLPTAAIPEGQFAIVELFGHTTLVGRIEEVDRFGTKMLSIEPLFNGDFLPAVLHGGASIYRLTPCDAATALKHQPREPYQLPATLRAIIPPTLLPAPEPIRFHDGVAVDAEEDIY